MIKTFTHHEQLVRSLYHETSEAENQELLSNASLSAAFAETAYEWHELKDRLDSILTGPSKACEDKILAYAFRGHKQAV